MTKNKKQEQIILCGDFNCSDISWDTRTTTRMQQSSSHPASLHDVNEEAQLSQVHSDSTRTDKLIDFIFTTSATMVKNSASVTGISDHDIVVTDFDTCIR